MAKINGVELKSIKPWRGIEYTGFSANIYLDGKKIGSAIDDGDGGGLFVDIDKEADKQGFEERYRAYLKFRNEPETENTVKIGDQILISALKELADLEKEFKKQAKKAAGHPFTLMELEKHTAWGYQSVGLYVVYKTSVETMLDKLKKGGLEFDKVSLYSSLADFNITL